MKKLLKIFLALCVFIIGLISISDYLTVSTTQDGIYSEVSSIPENRVGLLLGTSKYIADGRRNLFYLYRIHAALELYKAGKVEYILATGDNGSEGYDEATAMYDDLIAGGVLEEHIYLDYAGFRTLDSVVRAKEVFGQEKYTIISQKFHLERAIYLAQSEGIDAIGYTAKDVPVKRAPRVWIRERLARVKMMIDIVFGKKPKFGGERIEIL